jgi:hypothetical protein
MRDQETTVRIRKRIENALSDIEIVATDGKTYKAPGRYDTLDRCRRAELLRRNKQFLSERQEAHRLLIERLRKKGQEGVYYDFEDPDKGWQDFCYRWGVADSWDGKLGTLDSWAWIAESALYYRKPSEETRSLLLGAPGLFEHRAARWPHEVQEEQSFMYLKIVPSLRFEDIQVFWPRIDKLKDEIWGFSERAKKNFERDICFWDLKNKPAEYGKMSFGNIMQKWNAAAPDRQKVKNTDAIKKAVKLIQTYIDRMTPIEG